jgi:hypothetical protein
LTDTPDTEQARYLIGHGHAELLEPYLRPEPKYALEIAIRDLVDAMRDTGHVYDAEVRRVKSELRTRNDRTIALTPAHDNMTPDETERRDSDLRTLRSTQQEIEGKTGAVWGEWDAQSRCELHYIVLWDEWPGLLQLLQGMATISSARQSRVRNWIEEIVNTDGLTCLALKDQ